MKKAIFTLVVTLAAFTLSCQKEEDCYSCIESVDAFVKANKELLLKSGVSSITTYDLETQKAAYRSFDNRKKASLWKEKFEKILRSDNLYTEEEIAEIHLLSNFISPEVIENSSEIQSFVDDWIQRTHDKFLWDIDRYRFFLFSLESSEQQFLSKSSKEMKSNGDCECNTSSGGIFIEDCISAIPDCRETETCDRTENGCGKFWADPCNGRCYAEVDPETDTQG